MPTVTPPAITALPTPPDPNDRATFNIRAYPWSVAQAVLATQVGAVATNVKANADDAATSSGTAATQAGLATSNGAAQVALATTQAVNATASADTCYANALVTNSDKVATGLDRVATAASAVQASKLNLGSKTSAPTLDNQSAALLAGATYYDSTLAKWRVWSGSAWVDGLSAIAGVSTVNGLSGAVVNIATTGTNIFTAAQNDPTGAAIASAATINLDTATGNRVHITGTTTITAVTLTRGPRTVIFDGVLTLTHNATTNNLPGLASITTAANDRAIYESDGTTVYCVSYIRANGAGVLSASVGDHEIVVHSGNGYGSTNLNIRRLTTTMTNTGTAITYADSATLGAAFTVNQTGLYSIYYAEIGGIFGVSINSTQLSTGFQLIAVANRVAMTSLGGAASTATSLSRVVRLTAGDVLRPHTNGSPGDTSDNVFFAIRKVGV